MDDADSDSIEIVLYRYTPKEVGADVVKAHVGHMTRATRGLVRGWDFTRKKIQAPVDRGRKGWFCRVDLTLSKTAHEASPSLDARVAFDMARTDREKFGDLPYTWEGAPTAEESAAVRARFEASRRGRREVPGTDAIDGAKVLRAHEVVIPPALVGKSGLKHIAKHQAFKDIYGRGAHIRRALCAIDSFRHTSLIGLESPDHVVRRNNVLFWGPTGGGKTEIVGGLRRLLPEGSHMTLDAPSCTRAGIISRFQSLRGNVPAVVFVEEIEKVPVDGLVVWLQMLDDRSEVTKLNFFVDQRFSVPFICVATCNDLRHLLTAIKGSLGSRFGHQIYVPMPNDEEMELILTNAAHRVGGSPEWVDACLRLKDEFDVKDPREVRSWLDYREGLTDGSAVRELREMLAREKGDGGLSDYGLSDEPRPGGYDDALKEFQSTLSANSRRRRSRRV